MTDDPTYDPLGIVIAAIAVSASVTIAIIALLRLAGYL